MKFACALVVCCGSLVVSGFPWSQPQSKPSFNWHNTDYLLAFGDSYTYVQGTAGRQNYSFIGDVQNFTFTKEKLLTNEIVQNQIGTSAGGPNWVEYLTGCFSGLPSKCKLQLWDFAFAGSDVSVAYTPLHHDYTVSLVNQIIQWATYAKPYLPIKPAKALVAVFIGINDINDSDKYTFPRYALNSTTPITGFSDLYNAIIGTEFEALETVWSAGYRNFLFMNLPPLDKTPSNLISATPLPNATMVHLYNSILSSHAANFSATHPGTKAMVFDTYNFLSGMLSDPSKYGLKNTTSYCKNYNAPDIDTNYAAYGCLPIEEYFWYNTGHITWKVHEYLAEAVGKFLNSEGC